MYNESVTDACDYNLDYARRLLAEDGWGDADDDGTLDKMIDDELIELTLNLFVYEEPDNDVRVATANMIKDNLAQIGITVTVNTVTMATMQEKLSAGSFHMALVSYAMDKVPDPGYLLISGNTGNYGRYPSSAMTELCSDLRKSVYQGDYQQKLMEIQSRFVEDCPFVCLFYRSGVVMTRLMYTTARDVRELELLRGIESFRN